jgi:hypothetical protein
MSGQRLDMQALARRLRLGRATLYRRAGNREQILDEVVWCGLSRRWSRQCSATAGHAELLASSPSSAVPCGRSNVIGPSGRFLESDPALMG